MARRAVGDFVPSGSVRGWLPTGAGGVRLALDGAVAEVCIARDGSVRLRAAAGDELPLDAGDALGREPWDASNAEPFESDAGGVALAFDGAGGAARVEIELDEFALTVHDRGGSAIARLDALAFAPDGGARVAQRVGEDDRLFGFGEKTGPQDRRGRVLVMRNRDHPVTRRADPLYLSIPFWVRLGSFAGARRTDGFLLDAIAPSRFDVAATDPTALVLETAAGGLDLTLFPGPAPADALRRFTARVGRAARPPLWALGHHQSRWGYRSERAVRSLARAIRRQRIPTDAIHLDIDHMRGYRVFTWHPKRFPDPKGLLADLAAQGFRAVPIVDPGVKVDPDWDVYRDGRARNLFLRADDGGEWSLRVWPKDAALPDFARPEVRDWWGEQHRPLLDAGAAGIWNDMNEPAGWTSDLRLGRLILPLRPQRMGRVEQAHPADPDRRVPHEHVRNAYGHLECRATHEALLHADPRRRPFVLTRSGFAGVQRWAAVWTGDTASTWAQLRLSVRMLLGLSVSGVPFCGADIGGFVGRCSRELFARWMQVGALYPFARTHSFWLKPRQEPWRFGRRVADVARAALELRMRLLPYLMHCFAEAEETGAPVWRPLWFEFPDDPEAAGVDDQLLIGADLLFAPVVERGAHEREVYLPAGGWTAWRDGARFVGPRRVRVAAPLEEAPLFARDGAVLPTRSPVRHTGERPAEPLVLEVFPGGERSSLLLEDDGETRDYLDGREARTPIRLRSRAGGRLRLELGRRSGAFEIAPRALRVAVHGCPRPTRVTVDSTQLPLGDPPERPDQPGCWWSDGVLHVRFADDGSPRTLEVEPAP